MMPTGDLERSNRITGVEPGRDAGGLAVEVQVVETVVAAEADLGELAGGYGVNDGREAKEHSGLIRPYTFEPGAGLVVALDLAQRLDGALPTRRYRKAA